MSNTLNAERTRESDEDVLLAEMRHRIANNFQLIGGLVRLRLRTAQGAEAREALTAILDEIASLGLLHQLLARPEKVSFDAFLRLSCWNWDRIARARGIALDVDAAGGVDLPDAALTSLALVAHELVTNCLEHAFPDDGGGGRISIEFGPDGDGFAVLVVSDDGGGLPRRPDGTGRHTPGMGHALVTRLTGGLGGSFEIGPRGPRGTTARVCVPVVARRRVAS